MKRITILGSNSGRNAGDAAILASIMDGISKLHPDTIFDVPTTNPNFIKKNYGKKYNVNPISIMPWTLSVRLLGLPTLISIARSDLVLITDGIIFDIKLFNPAFNFLITLIFLVPFARLFRKSVVCFCVGIGPLNTYWGKIFARLVGNRCQQIMVREKDSYDLMRSIGVNTKMDIYADIAFRNLPVPTKINFTNKNKGIIGINITGYGSTWIKGRNSNTNWDKITETLINTMNKLVENLSVNVAIITTQIMDIEFAKKIINGVKYSESVKFFNNNDYSNHQLMGIMGQLDLFIGMRLHSLILASAMTTPIIGLTYAPKVLSLMELLDLKKYVLELNRIKGDTLYQLIYQAWQEKNDLKTKLAPKIETLKNQANLATQELTNNYL